MPIVSEPNDGSGAGTFFAPSSMSAQNQSRSDGRVAYLDKVLDRTNLHVATEQMATRILLAEVDAQVLPNQSPALPNPQEAVGVEFASSAEAPRVNVSCTKEVILAAGAIFSPTLLQISGVGPRAVLEPLGISVKVDLPGVGANLQDHGMIHPVYRYSNSSLLTADRLDVASEERDAALDEYYTNRTGPLTAPMISTVAFPSLQQLTEDWASLLDTAEGYNDSSSDSGSANASTPTSSSSSPGALPSDTHPDVRRGYMAQRALQLRLLSDPTEASIELLADSIGTISAAAQRPLSRGTVRPRSADPPFGQTPLVDPRYCADPLDCAVLARALQLNCALTRTSAMASLQPAAPAAPFAGSCPTATNASSPSAAQSAAGGCGSRSEKKRDEDEAEALDIAALEEMVRKGLTTEFHPSGTTAMMPLDMGGVVDTALRVYGTRNLRVVDAGVMPMVLGAHLQAAVYAIAERAADIIKGES